MNEQLMVCRWGDTVMDWDNIKPITGDSSLKPDGGIWTSTHLGNGESEWTQWCKLNELSHWVSNNKHVITINDTANILTFDDKENVKMFEERFVIVSTRISQVEGFEGMLITSHNIDWVKVAENFDGIHMTHKGLNNVWRKKFLLGWDIESSVWFRNVFKEVVPF